MNLYKYLSEDRISILKDGLIRFTQPQAFNDPFEFKPHVTGIGSDAYLEDSFNQSYEAIYREEYENQPDERKARISLDEFSKFAELMRSAVFKSFKNSSTVVAPMLKNIMHEVFENNIGVLSLTEWSDNLLMWAHYANSHQGFVVEFDGAHEFFNRRRSEHDELQFLRKVEYSKTRPNFALSELEDLSVFLAKGDDWSYEQEWRMLLALRDADKIIKSEPYDIHLFQIPFSAFTSILIGARAEPEIRSQIVETINQNKALSHVNVVEMCTNDKHFKLER